jgi:hypothetical protein
MKSSDLLTLWEAPDNSRLTNKQFSFRLPVHVAARIAALCEMYPAKSRTQIVGDLLAAALDEVATQFPDVQGRFFMHDDNSGNDVYEDAGQGSRFRELSNKHFKELEVELGNETPQSLFDAKLVFEVPRKS